MGGAGEVRGGGEVLYCCTDVVHVGWRAIAGGGQRLWWFSVAILWMEGNVEANEGRVGGEEPG